MHRVFPFSSKKSVSSQIYQLHETHNGDRRAVVTPFMQVRTYPARAFATFEPLELQQPFTVI